MQLRESTLKRRKLSAPHWNNRIHKYERGKKRQYYFFKDTGECWTIIFNHFLRRIDVYFKTYNGFYNGWFGGFDLRINVNDVMHINLFNTEIHKHAFYDRYNKFGYKIYNGFDLYIINARYYPHIRDEEGLTDNQWTRQSLGQREYVYLTEDTEMWYGYAAAHHWRNLYLRKQWLKKHQNFCKFHFFPYFGNMLVRYLY